MRTARAWWNASRGREPRDDQVSYERLTTGGAALRLLEPSPEQSRAGARALLAGPRGCAARQTGARLP
jgi:hypothetical protein